MAPNPTATTTPGPTTDIPQAEAVCTDGTATVSESNSQVSISGDCDTVIINASNSIVTVGAVKNLEINGAINEVTATSVDSVTFTSDANTLIAGNAPQITDNGQQNEVKTK